MTNSMTDLKKVFVMLFWDYFLRISTLSTNADFEMVKELEATSATNLQELPVLIVHLNFLDFDLFYQFVSAVEVFLLNDDSQIVCLLQANSYAKKITFHFSFHIFRLIEILLERKTN